MMKKPILSVVGLSLPLLAGIAGATVVTVPIDLTSEVASSSTAHPAGPPQNGIDGNLGNFTHTAGNDPDPWWRVDFAVERTFNKLVIHNRDSCCQSRLSDITVQAFDETDAEVFNSGELNDGNALNSPAFIEVPVPTTSAWSIKVSRDPASAINNEGQGVLSIGELVIGGEEDIFLPPNTNLSTARIAAMTTAQSSNWNGFSTVGAEAVDGNLATESHTSGTDTAATWSVDLGEMMSLQRVKILNRDDCCGNRLRDVTLRVLDGEGVEVFNSGLLNPANELGFANAGGQPGLTVDLRALNGGAVMQGQVVEIARTMDPGSTGADALVLSMGEVQVIGSSDVGPDSEPDGMPDNWETHFGLVVGTDDSAGDPDGDGLSNVEEYDNATDPNVADSDGDEVNDGLEVKTYESDPLVQDTDGDTLTDGEEVNTHGTNPILADTDGDQWRDDIELLEGSDPLLASSFPNLTLVRVINGLLGGDITDPEDNGVKGPGIGTNFAWFNITASSKQYFSGFGGNQGAFDVFDNSLNGTTGKWCCDAPPQQVTVEFLAPHSLTHFTVTSSNDSPQRDPLDWEIQGSNDGVNWDVIYPAPGTDDVSSNVWTSRNQTIRFDLPAATPFYTFFRYQVYTTGGNTQHALAELEYFGERDMTDSDGDGMPDWYENFYAFLNPNDEADAAGDEDGEGLTNLEEFNFGSDPDNPDTDDDGLEDDEEQSTGTDPRLVDTDGDLFSDKLEVDLGSNPTDNTSLPALNPIAWEAPVNISGMLTDFDTTGTLVAAWAADVVPVTVGGIEFAAGGPSLGSQAFGFDPWDRLEDIDYETLLDGGTYAPGPQVIALTGLTPGETYRVQIWVADTRSCCPGRVRTFTTDPSTFDAAVTADVESGSFGNEELASGQYVIGTFTAAGDTQYIFATSLGGGPQFNAMMLRQGSAPAGDLLITDFSYDGATATLTVTGFDTSKLYQLRRSEDLKVFADVGAPFTPPAATGLVQDTAPTGPAAFYQIEEVVPE